MSPPRRPPLWTCPRCGVKFVNRNQWHSCGRATLKEWKARMGPRARELFDRFEEMIAACGPYHVGPASTRIAFLGRVRFAGITSLSERGMTCAFALPHPLSSPRFAKVEEVAPGWWQHSLRVTRPEQLDGEIQEWLRMSYGLMGMQERLDRENGRTAPRGGSWRERPSADGASGDAAGVSALRGSKPASASRGGWVAHDAGRSGRRAPKPGTGAPPSPARRARGAPRAHR